MSASGRDWKKDLAKAAFVAMPMLAPLVAGAKIDYEGIYHCISPSSLSLSLSLSA